MTPEKYLEFHVLDDAKVVTAAQLGDAASIGLQEGRRAVWDFHQKHKEESVLYLSVVTKGDGANPFKIEIKPTAVTGSVDVASVYAVGSVKVAAPALPSDHYPKVGVPVVVVAGGDFKKRKRRVGDSARGKPENVKKKREVLEVLSDSDDEVIVID